MSDDAASGAVGRAVAERIEIQLNGEPFSLPRGTTLAGLLEQLQRHPRTVAVERNGEIVPRDRFEGTPLGAGDRLELVQFVQGG